MKTGLDHFSNSALVRVLTVAAWTTISLMAYFSRFERMTPMLATMMAAVICGIGALGMGWAVWPAARNIYRRKPEPHRSRRALRG